MIFLLLCLIFLVLLFFYNNILYFVLFLITFIVLLFKTKKKLLYVVTILIFIILYKNVYDIKDSSISNSSFLVDEVKENYVIVKQKNIKILLYDKNTKLIKDDILEIKSEVRDINSNNSFELYLKKKRVNFVFIKNDYTILKPNNSLLIKFKNYLYSKHDEKTLSYLQLFLFNEKRKSSEEILSKYNLLSIGFLLVVSGFHINFLFKTLNKIFYKIKKRRIISYLIIYIYLVFLSFSISSLRAFLFLILKDLNIKKNKYTNIDILCFIACVFLFSDPSLIFSLSFLLSFLFSFINILNSKIKNKTLKKINFIMFLIPIILLLNYEINIFALIMTFVFVKPSIILYFFSFITFFFPKFSSIYSIVIQYINKLFGYLVNPKFFIIFGKPSIVFLIIYFLFWLINSLYWENKFSTKKMHYLIILLLMLSFQYLKPYTNQGKVTFLNIGQGDCNVIFIPHKKEVILIDAGDVKNKDVGENIIIPYLKKNGINKIKKVILSHDDYDHTGSLPTLLENFSVDEVIDSSLIEKVEIKDSTFINLNISEFRDNDGSIVLYGEFIDINFLFTGDISSEVEKEIINKNNINVDVLKVAHHGSKNSTSNEFLERVKPKIAIISVGVNIYKHPNIEVLDRLNKNNIIILRTDQDGHISIAKNFMFKTYLKYEK